MSSMAIFFIVLLLPICIWILYIFIRALILFPIEIYKSNFKQGICKYKLSLIFFILIISPYFYFKHKQELDFVNILPLNLEVDSIVIHDYGDFREGCQVAIFNLSDSAIEKINKQGLNFFDSSLQPRNILKKDLDWKYEQWSLLNNQTNVSWLNCKRELEEDITNKIHLAVKSKGGYYTHYNGVYLVVVPSLSYIIYSYGS